MDLIKIALAMLFLVAAWGMWKRTALDTTRDRLFDLRNELRTWFLENGYQLNHPLYKELRDLLNSHLRFTEDIRFVGMLWFVRTTPPNIAEHMQQEIVRRFATDDPRLMEMTESFRRSSARTLQKYMMATSTLFAALVIAIIPFAVASAIQQGIRGFWLHTKLAVAARLDESAAKPSSLEVVAVLQTA